jgi:hypothetical protein
MRRWDAVNFCLKGFKSTINPDLTAAGIVARPLINIYDAEGNLIWWKLRHKDRNRFMHTKGDEMPRKTHYSDLDKNGPSY